MLSLPVTRPVAEGVKVTFTMPWAPGSTGPFGGVAENPARGSNGRDSKGQFAGICKGDRVRYGLADGHITEIDNGRRRIERGRQGNVRVSTHAVELHGHCAIRGVVRLDDERTGEVLLNGGSERHIDRQIFTLRDREGKHKGELTVVGCDCKRTRKHNPGYLQRLPVVVFAGGIAYLYGLRRLLVHFDGTGIQGVRRSRVDDAHPRGRQERADG